MTAPRLIGVISAVVLSFALGACGTSDGEPPSRITNQTQTSWPTTSAGGDVSMPDPPASPTTDLPGQEDYP